ncbi:MAG: excinuclease ABC subunit UvrA, partial [Candidatus Omnitrophica bacterium]|nr:excinuclease ABC subunit UvrA [Candidatus Omnitrophota bacterium]
MDKDVILIKGAREHNLKNIDLEIPRNKLVVITGLSGSGKSSLAFDTIYAEGQRRYVESLSSYARQFLEQLQKPDVEYIEGLSPAISIEQKTAGSNPRSTVGTQTEVYDYLRLLFARVGTPHCPKCGKPITRQTSQEIVEQISALPVQSEILILAPLVRGRKGEYAELFQRAKKDGYVRMRVDGRIYEVDKPPKLDKNKKHDIEIVVDRLTIKEGINKRLADSVETALEAGKGLVIVCVEKVTGGEGKEPAASDLLFSEQYACVDCGISIGEISPRSFSFNSPYGACPMCDGLGNKMEIDPDLVIPDRRKSIDDGAVVPWASPTAGWYHAKLEAVARHFGFSTGVPVGDLDPEFLDIILYGAGDAVFRFRYENAYGQMREYEGTYEGVIPNLERRYRESDSDAAREWIEEFMSSSPCPSCGGARLKPASLAVTVGSRSIAQAAS